MANTDRPTASLPGQLGDLAHQAADLAEEFADEAVPTSESPFGVLEVRVRPRQWSSGDVRFLREGISALVAVAGAQMRGVAHVLTAGSPIHLHPLVTLVRGVAEACGKIWWLIDPFIPESANKDIDLTAEQWDALAERVIHRSQLARLDTLAERRRRIETSQDKDSTAFRSAQAEVDAFKEALTDAHGDVVITLSGARSSWRVVNERLPRSTEMVIAVTEYAYGDTHRGTGRNPYPMYSGYAHASLELVFSHAGSTNTSPISTLIQADEIEVRRLGGSALRTFAVAFEMSASMFAWDLNTFREWEEHVDPLIIETGPDGRQ